MEHDAHDHPAIRILIADDVDSVRNRLQRILEAESGYKVVASVSGGDAAVAKALELRPDVVIMDVEMERRDSGISASRRINDEAPEIRIIVLTVHNDEHTVLAAFQSGIVDFLTKDQALTHLAEAVRLACTDKSPLRPIVAEKLRDQITNLQQREEQLLFTIRIVSTLTASELTILRDIVNGKSRRQIASDRFVELVTVKKHVNSIHKKFGTRSTAAIVKQIASLGIFDVLDGMFPHN